jgi:hypothetical protein
LAGLATLMIVRARQRPVAVVAEERAESILARAA